MANATVTRGGADGYGFLDVDGTKIRVYRAGAASGRALVYLHSGAGEVGPLPFFDQLAEAGFGVIVPEFPGFGASDSAVPPWHSLEDAVFHLRRVMDLVADGAVPVVGSSFGGWLAAEIAVWFPERVSSLVLIDAVGLRIEGVPVFNVFGTPGVDTQEEMMQRGNPHGFDALSAIAPAMSDTDVDPEIKIALHFVKGQAAMARIGWNPYLHDPRLLARLKLVSAPTLVLWGEDDGLAPREHADAFVAEIPNSQFEVIPTTGHNPALEAPGVVAKQIAAFLEK